MNSITVNVLRAVYGDHIEHFSDESLEKILFLTHNSMIRLDDTFLEYLRCWTVCESFVDAVYELELGDVDEDMDSAEQEADAKQRVINAGYEYFTTSDHEVVVLTQ
jgi:hypothetical protein